MKRWVLSDDQWARIEQRYQACIVGYLPNHRFKRDAVNIAIITQKEPIYLSPITIAELKYGAEIAR